MELSLRKHHHIRIKFFVLMLSLFLLLLIYPFLELVPSGEKILNLALSLIALTGTYAVSYNKKSLIPALLLGIPLFLTGAFTLISDLPLLIILNHVVGILFYAYTAFIILHYILTQKRITSNNIFGGVCVYLLFGVLWAVAFSLVGYLQPGAITFLDGGTLAWGDYIYFSFGTLTTLGYGDITPLSSFAQSLAILEAVIGVLYLTVLIARLIGIYIVQWRK